MSAAGIGVCVGDRRRRDPARSRCCTSASRSCENERGVGLGEALRLLASSRHLQIIAMVIGFAAIGASIIDQQLNMAGGGVRRTAETSLTAFFAEVTFYLSLASFVIQVGPHEPASTDRSA